MVGLALDSNLRSLNDLCMLPSPHREPSHVPAVLGSTMCSFQYHALLATILFSPTSMVQAPSRHSIPTGIQGVSRAANTPPMLLFWHPRSHGEVRKYLAPILGTASNGVCHRRRRLFTLPPISCVTSRICGTRNSSIKFPTCI